MRRRAAVVVAARPPAAARPAGPAVVVRRTRPGQQKQHHPPPARPGAACAAGRPWAATAEGRGVRVPCLLSPVSVAPQPPPPGGGGGWDRLFVLDVWTLAFFCFRFFRFCTCLQGQAASTRGGKWGEWRRHACKKNRHEKRNEARVLSSPALGGRASRRRRHLRAPDPAQFHSKHTTHTHTPLQKKETHARKHTPLSSHLFFCVCVCGRESTSRTGARSPRAAAPPIAHHTHTPHTLSLQVWGLG